MRGSIVKRGKTYSIIVEMERDHETGKRRQKWISGFKTKREAEAELARKIAEIENGTFIDSKKVTLNDYMRHWIEIHKSTISERTHLRYMQLINLHIKPLLGEMLMTKIKPMHIQKFYTDMANIPRKDGKEGNISPTTIYHAHNVLHKAFKDAVKWQIISVNPVSAVTPPRRNKKECRVLDNKSILQVLEVVKGTYLEMPVYLGLSTGGRLGEILGLQWADVDLKKGIIYIRQSMMRKEDGTLALTQTKTPKSRRAIEIGPDTIKKLKAHKIEQASWKLAAGEAWQENNLVCCLQDGRAINPNSLSSRFSKLVRKAGLNLGFHDLRHTHATMLLKAGVHPKIVSERLGHSTVGMTLDVYSHVLPTMQREAATLIEKNLSY